MKSVDQTKTAADVMTRGVRTIPAEATLRETAEMLSIHHISGAPVVDADGRMIGIITESDLMNSPRKRAAMPHVAAFGVFLAPEETLQRIYHDGATLLAEEVMTPDPITAPPDATLRELSQIMTKRHINRIPIVEEGREGGGKTLVGIVTREDVLRGLFGLPDPDHVG